MKRKSYPTVLLLLALLLVCIATFRTVGFDRDSMQYLDSYNAYTDIFNADILSREPMFWVFTAIGHILPGDGFRWVLLAYAALGMAINVKAIKRLTPHPVLALICFAFLYFPLHTMTQIRASIACALLLLAIPDIVDRRLKAFLIKVFVATLFHYSAIILLPLYLIRVRQLNFKFYMVMPLAALIFSLFNNLLLNVIELLSTVLPQFLAYKISIYITLLNSAEKNEINIFSLYYVSIFMFYYACLFNISKFKSDLEVACIKILGWSLSIYYIMSFFPVFAVRVAEMLGVVIIIVIPSLIYKMRERVSATLLLMLWLVIIFVNNVFVHELFNF